ncbi:MAG: hypothetical protein ACHQNV_01915 [Vicinamibacteria bacterium]
MRRTRTRSLAVAALALFPPSFGCATAFPPPPKSVLDAALSKTSYSGSVRVSLHGPEVRARARALVAFERPDRLRIEVPGPGGLRLVVVSRAGRLTAAFPGERAVFASEATAESLESLLGVRLTPSEVMDILLGSAPAELRSYEARWGQALPKAVVAVLADGTRLGVDIDDAQGDAILPAAAFDDPPHDGYRSLDASEARRLWSGK